MVRRILDQVCRHPPVLAVVDDDPAVRHALSFAFETAGISVATFADPESVLAASRQHDWRCLIIDQVPAKAFEHDPARLLCAAPTTGRICEGKAELTADDGQQVMVFV